MPYAYELQAFDYNGEPRRRPVKVTGKVPVIPHKSPARIDVQPRVLHGVGGIDVPPHNTVRGHLIGLDSLGGQEIEDNLVPTYGQFNLSAYKVRFESVLKDKVQNSAVQEADLVLQIHYESGDVRIPTKFSFTLNITYKDGSKATVQDTIPHPAPEPVYVPYSAELAKYLKKMIKQMKDASWWVEDHVGCAARSPKSFNHGKPLIVPPKDHSLRPYAVLDYILYPTLKKNDFFDASCSPELDNGWAFTTNQTEAILKVNAALHDGYNTSDDLDDYVYKGKEALFKDPERTKYYYLHAHASSGGNDGVLSMGGYHQKPEIDHYCPKGKEVNQGANAYSNARVISRYLNSADRS